MNLAKPLGAAVLDGDDSRRACNPLARPL